MPYAKLKLTEEQDAKLCALVPEQLHGPKNLTARVAYVLDLYVFKRKKRAKPAAS